MHSHPHAPHSKLILAYGIFLFLIGIVAVLYIPETGQIAYNAKAKTAIISGSICGGISALWAILYWFGQRWARWAAVATTSLYALACIWRASIAWIAVASGSPEKWYAGTLITLMLLASLALLTVLFRKR